ncbi:MAG: lipoate--protein ligase family protein [Solirubrobacteraceae bacterium]
MLELFTDSFASDPALDIALSQALLREVAAGARGPVLRIFTPGAAVAFGRLDSRSPGFEAAAGAARRGGFVPVLRSAGGHAAAYDEGSVILEHIVVADGPDARLEPRFQAMTALILGALSALGVPARAGEVPGEYCPGAHSINLGGRAKIAGVAQRVIARAALTSAVIVVSGSARIRTVTDAVYRALGLPFDPGTVGAVEDAAPVGVQDMTAALRAVYAAGDAVAAARVDAPLAARARALAGHHRIGEPLR